jgi:hypothetical protein
MYKCHEIGTLKYWVQLCTLALVSNLIAHLNLILPSFVARASANSQLRLIGVRLAMDVAGIVRDTITIVFQLAAVVHDAKGTRDELEGLHPDIRALETALKLCEDLVKGDAELGEAFRHLAGDARQQWWL